jgi:hypothetical protein
MPQVVLLNGVDLLQHRASPRLMSTGLYIRSRLILDLKMECNHYLSCSVVGWCRSIEDVVDVPVP